MFKIEIWKNIHRIFEKTAEYEPDKFARVNTVAIYLTKTFIQFTYKVLALLNAEIRLNTTFYSFAWKIKSMTKDDILGITF